LYQVFNRRYQRGSTIVTTNLVFKEWGKLFHNSAAALAIADRLVIACWDVRDSNPRG
jgi:DNA replication protein DnaC